MTEQSPQDPELNKSAARTLLWITPFAFVGTYLLAAVQGAEPKHCALIGGVMVVGCLGTAALLRLRGSKAAGDMAWIRILLALLARR